MVNKDRTSENTFNTSSMAESIAKEIPEIKKFGLLDKLAKSLEKQKSNIRPDNPFLKVQGEYTFHIDTEKSGEEKTNFIHNKITDYLFDKTGQLYVFSPGDNSKVYALDVTSNKNVPDKPLPKQPTSYKVSTLLKDAPSDIQKLLTQYPTIRKSKVKIKISTDPIDIVKKSTHQSWESCETVGSTCDQGIFSDIENNNAIAYVYVGDNKEADGRFMLRWCNTPKKKADIGIEPIMYPRKSYSMEIYDLLRKIINKKGYGTYKSCTTPYTYEGYSDYIGGSGEITYHSSKSSSSNRILIQYASLPNISRNLALALAEHTTDRSVRRALAENKSICDIEDVVNKLSKDIDTNTKIHLVCSCKLTKTAFDNLINEDNKKIRVALAQNQNLVDKKHIDTLANDTTEVRRSLASNNTICNFGDVVTKLSGDIDNDTKINLIKGCVSSHQKVNKLTDTAINNLVNDKSEDVRKELAKVINNVDKKYFDKLANDTINVINELLYNGEICNFEDIVNKLSKDTDVDNWAKAMFAQNCASRNKLSEIATNNLIKDKSANVRGFLASNIKDKKYLDILVNDEEHFVRWKLASNKAICNVKDVVNKLSKDSDYMTKTNLIETCTESPYKLTETAINNLKNDDDEDVRLALAKAIKTRKFTDI